MTARPGHDISGWVHAGPRILPHSDGHGAHCQSHQQPRRGVALSQVINNTRRSFSYNNLEDFQFLSAKYWPILTSHFRGTQSIK